VVVLVWTYSSQILFFGAELIRAYAKYFDPAPIVTTELAVPIRPAELAKQGMPPAEPDSPATNRA
jgi:uncharacterized BrkB/YihY/UPF0761 family membrane protein